MHQGCLPWGSRVIISEPLRRRILSMIHKGHMGVVKMKAIARSHVLWSGNDEPYRRRTLCRNTEIFIRNKWTI